PHQVREHERMRGMGQRVVVVDSLKGVDEVLA
ncbi:VRR-NUC domain-containing protein, partial [Xylella fastidiosa subsp. fastidiosa]|nr:VRR-NUC domain-containing protein [Xylella fastidiosa subsp. fastidiosa]MBE0263414.1 VRR-NUC domain-containing protein [Xylella fastidiosa subsp. fastidiosa]MBE0265606.1 VRR-NUC domain-containing protein [Xylella fastidiosa subsp. fastidiosa]MBE0265610.1 VRR-NUC domain-containing protein [Xylella fastidiosa subsp. fastidiosa]MBE0267806.1 VRR-NUC domain-containing protein [Xylella fastidiosa subsp. fastidiosa]